MRSFTLASLVVSSLALFAAASPEPCSDHPGVVHKPGEYSVPEVAKLALPKKPKSSNSSKPKSSSHATKSSSVAQSSSAPRKTFKERQKAQPAWAKSTKKVQKKPTPKIKNASPQTIAQGASKVISSFANASYIPPEAAGKLTNGTLRSLPLLPNFADSTLWFIPAISSAIDKQVGHTSTAIITQTHASVHLATKVAEATRTITVADSTIKVPEPTTIVQTVTQNVTQVQTSTLITTSDAVAASLDIKKALDEAFAAANLSQSDLGNTTTQALEACLAEVLSSGGLPNGYSCLTQSGSDSAGLQSTLNTILEQVRLVLFDSKASSPDPSSRSSSASSRIRSSPPSSIRSLPFLATSFPPPSQPSLPRSSRRSSRSSPRSRATRSPLSSRFRRATPTRSNRLATLRRSRASPRRAARTTRSRPCPTRFSNSLSASSRRR